MNIGQLAFGIATYLPGVYNLVAKGTGGTNSARYCYSVWLRHLVMAFRNGLSAFPTAVAELGPGDSIGIGLSALLSGAEKYFAFDVVEYSDLERNVQIFDELVTLFNKREDIPGEAEFPEVKPYLDSYDFPHAILTEEHLNESLTSDRIRSIRQALIQKDDRHTPAFPIRYCAPWFDRNIIEKGTIDMVFSQAVMEHVDAPSNVYANLFSWLKPGGIMSHQIDFRSHGTAKEWNGHWAYSDLVWTLIKGRRPYLLNRLPHSAHVDLMEKCGFRIVCDLMITNCEGLKRNDLSARFRNLSENDLTTSGVFIQALKV